MASRKFISAAARRPPCALLHFPVGVQPDSGAHRLENGVRNAHFKGCDANILCEINAL
jgi:hypothetical protein